MPPRVLVLATYFPKPANPAMGVWALRQAQSFARNGMAVRVVSLTSWVPRSLARTPRLRAWADCPPRHDWGGLTVDYPRWPFYQVPPLKAAAYRDPLPQSSLAWPFAERALRRVVREFRPDVVFAHHAAVNGELARRFGLPYVVVEQDSDEVRDALMLPARRRAYRRVMSAASATVGLASPMAHDLRQVAPRANVVAVHHGADPVPPRRERGDDRVVVLCAAMLYPRKGVPLLVRAFAEAAGRHPTAALRIAGDGEDRPAVDRAVAECGLAGRVELLGVRPHADVLEEMRSADLFALVGRGEAFGVVFAEAASAGLPLIWPADAGAADVFLDGVHGYEVPPGSESATAAALDRLLADRMARLRMGDAARKVFSERLTWDANARRMRELFEEARR